MGYGGYSYEAHQAIASARHDLPVQQVFKQARCHPLMNPHGVKVRESRDSIAHPHSLGIVFALDVTGSMGEIPELLARRELPGFVKLLIDHRIADPQVLFLAVGDAFSDGAPLQVGQFESAAELMDQWLTWSWLEGGGGEGGHESYELALYFAARHLDLDCWRVRSKRGYLLLTGDEKPYPRLSRQAVRAVIGDDVDEDLPLAVVVEEAQRALEPFFLIPDLDRRRACERAWRDVLGDRVICMESPQDTCAVAAGIVAISEGAIGDLDGLAAKLRERGLARERVNAVARALAPWAATIGKDGAPLPALDPGALLPPEGDSTHRRV
jgi:hypothetical protein